jgi:hypothetical protein
MLKFDDTDIFNLGESLYGSWVYSNLTPQPGLVRKVEELMKLGTESNKYLASQLKSFISPTTYNDFISGEVVQNWISVQAIRINCRRGIRPDAETSSFRAHYNMDDSAASTTREAFSKFDALHLKHAQAQSNQDPSEATLKDELFKLAAVISHDIFHYYEYRPY